MMKRILILLILFQTLLKAQSPNFGDRPLPVPSIDSYSTYVNTPVSPATGVPNINIPVYTLESANAGMNVNVSLSYHVYNAQPQKAASEVGSGWSVFKEAVISREIKDKPDEYKDYDKIIDSEKDIYYYNIPGHSGKFKIVQDSVTGNYSINHLSSERIKIELQTEPDPKKLKPESFTITDDRGFRYIFQDYDMSNNGSVFKSAFHATRIFDPNNQEIVSYTYDYKVKYKGTSTIYEYRRCKVTSITTSKGSLRFVYDYNSGYGNGIDNDPYSITEISLYNAAGQMIRKHQFQYESLGSPVYNKNNGKRFLAQIIRKDKNNTEYERISLVYDTEGSSTSYGYYTDNTYGIFPCKEDNTFINPRFHTVGLLKKITYPTKGYTVYDFESNEVYEDRSLVDYSIKNEMEDPEVQYYELTDTINYDTNISSSIPLTILGNATNEKYNVYVTHELIDTYLNGPHHTLNPADFRISGKDYTRCDLTSAIFPVMKFNILKGSKTMEISGGGKGILRVYQMKYLPAPLKNVKAVASGARVKGIRHFDSTGNRLKEVRYGYNDFTDSNRSSGYFFEYENGSCSLAPGEEPETYVLYKNVKQTEYNAGIADNGYTRYYFKTPEDYRDPLTSDMLYYNITSLGVMEKQEVYNSQNHKVSSSEYDYDFQNIPDAHESSGCLFRFMPAYTAYSKETSKLYTGGTVYQTVSETGYNVHNFQPAWKKETSADGTVNETLYRYAQEKSNTRLLNANMIVTPLETETKLNGITVSKSETRYENPGHLNPTSVVSYDLQNVPETQMVFDIYDSKGNPVQATGKSGIPTTTIWGYHQTLPVASISGAAFFQVSSLPSVLAVISASDADADDPMQEPALLLALENLRTDPLLKDYVVSGTTYDPLVGVTHTISPNGIRTTREYDAAGRLKKVKNASGETLKEYDYHYKP